jgi:uncharacterized protein YukE
MDHMKEQIKQVKETAVQLSALLEELISDRNDYHDDKSERWQEGDAGQAYYDKTSELEDFNSTLYDFIEEL